MCKMDNNLLAPLDELEVPTLDDAERLDSRIPIPSPEYLKKMNSSKGHSENNDTKLVKYQKEYEAFCSWAALPKEERKPKTAVEFERKNMLPKGYTNYFKGRDDFNDKRLTYFWQWMMDLYPDVVHAVYKRAVGKSSKDAAIFIDLLSKKMQLDKPKMQIQPMVIMGVPQEKIDALFTPKGYDAGVVPGEVIKNEKANKKGNS
jgi:hypothetical protein